MATREELSKAQLRHITLDEALEQYRTKMVAGGSVSKHINSTHRCIVQVFSDVNINSLTDIRRETIERWVANEVQKQERTPCTINYYLATVKAFVQYLEDIELLSKNPLKSIRKLNPEIGQRKKRRAMTADEVKRLLDIAASDNPTRAWKAGERMLIYRLLIGTGLRSMELSLLTPNQIDFEHCLLRVEAAKTKNKKADVLPLRADLVQSLKEWVALHNIQPQEYIFHYHRDSIRVSFYHDLKAAGIERIGTDGRSLDVHALRKTFGTMLAKAGVPLTCCRPPNSVG